MRIVATKGTIEYVTPNAMSVIELAARNCYKSEGKAGENPRFLAGLAANGHMSIFEHAHMTSRVICSRTCSHQLVRHRLCSFAQESQRYCAYSDGIAVVIPTEGMPHLAFSVWQDTVLQCEKAYLKLLETIPAQEARSILPGCTKTELVVTANFRQWLTVFKERAWNSGAQHEIRELMQSLEEQLVAEVPGMVPVIEAVLRKEENKQ